MDRPINSFCAPTPARHTAQRYLQQKATHNTPYIPNSPPVAQIGSTTSASTCLEAHPLVKPLNRPSASRNKASKLNSLISKFEGLDSASLNSGVRERQPRFLRDSKTVNPEMGRMNVTRESLLRSFDRPGWGAETLRGLSGIEDVGAYRGFDEMDSGIGRGYYGSKMYESASAPASSARSSRIREGGKLCRDVRTKEGGEGLWSKVKDRVRFFDGSTDKHPTQISKLRNGTGADGVVASRATSQQATSESPAVTRPYSESPRKQAGIERTPTGFGRRVRDEVAPASSGRFDGFQETRRATPVRLNQNIDPAFNRGRSRHRAQYLSPTQTPARAWEVARQRNDAFEATIAKQNERVREVYTATPSKNENAADVGLYMAERNTMMISNPFLTPRAVFGEGRMNERMIDEYHSHLESKGSEPRIGEPQGTCATQRPRRESKVQAHIMLFNQEGQDPRCRPPPPTSLSKCHPLMAPQEVYPAHIQPLITTQPTSQKKRPRSQTPPSHAHPASPNPQTMSIPSATPTVQVSQTLTHTPTPPPSPPQPPHPHTPAPRKQSQINDRIRHFESIYSGQPGPGAHNGSHSEPPRPKAKRVETWPMPTATKIKTKAPAPIPSQKEDELKSENNSAKTPRRTTRHTDAKSERNRQRERSREKYTHRIQAQQERLLRRSRSRSRTGVGTTVGIGPATGDAFLEVQRWQQVLLQQSRQIERYEEKERYKDKHRGKDKQQWRNRDEDIIDEKGEAEAEAEAQDAHARAKVQFILDSASRELSKRYRRKDARRGPGHGNGEGEGEGEDEDEDESGVHFSDVVDVFAHSHDDQQDHSGHVAEIWVDGSDDGGETVRGGGRERETERERERERNREVLVVNSVIAQCELAQPKPLRLAETIRMVRLCNKGFGERGGRGMGLGIRM